MAIPTVPTPSLAPAIGDNPTTTSFPAVNSFGILGNLLPGKWTLVSATKKFGWQIQKGNALTYATVWPIGDELIEPEFKGEIWTQEDVRAFLVLRQTLLVKPAVTTTNGQTGISSALNIDHPELKALGVDAVVLSDISPLIQSEGGMWECTIKFIQWKKPIPAIAKPKQVIPPVGPKLGPPTKATVVIEGLQASSNTKRANLGVL